ncbi:uncharacterized protein I303_104364 [Kwoniella dejecticola CBS 10117]|uniref:Uncharacterized protein n=1 Tax=Kwoniella dejecticola CBS 10117 TaxID=1296121 RepID=A0A1A6A5J8_9TREE|nr:uncharacterized protein I303_04660 [Kwoniella dejecticola CBS 10117]OBR85325.1 hypothetical protein I303_04660 [Kwoniella dejecticola CBS 10117]
MTKPNPNTIYSQAQIEEIMSDLDKLSQQIPFLSERLSHHPHSASRPDASRLSRLISIVSKKTSLRGNHNRKRIAKGYSSLKDEDGKEDEPLLSPNPKTSRRQSSDSDRTLVNSSSPLHHTSAEDILNELSPLIRELQRISNLMISTSPPYRTSHVFPNNEDRSGTAYQLIERFIGVCDDLIELVNTLNMPQRVSGNVDGDGDDHNDDGMRELLIAALKKKIQVEADRLKPNTHILSYGHSHPRPRSPYSISINVTSLEDKSKNPFIVHATSLTASDSPSSDSQRVRRNDDDSCSNISIAKDDDPEEVMLLSPSNISITGRRRESQPIKIANPSLLLESETLTNVDSNTLKKQNMAPFSHFNISVTNPTFSKNKNETQTAFQTDTTTLPSSSWAQNIIRIGSYQASLLFSNSPIAVRRSFFKVHTEGDEEVECEQSLLRAY